MLADVGFLSGVDSLLSGLEGADSDRRDEVTLLGLREAHRLFDLAGDAKGAFFDRVEINLEGGAATSARASARFTFGPGFATAGSAAPAPGPSFAAPSPAMIDASVAALAALRLPGDTPGRFPDDALMNMIREAGPAGWLVAAPLFTIAAAGVPLRPVPTVFEPPEAVAKLERVGIYTRASDNRDVFVGILPRGASASLASCVLAGAEPCKNRLHVGAPALLVTGHWVRLVRLGDRFAVLVAEDRNAVDTAVVSPRAAQAAAQVELATKEMHISSGARWILEAIAPTYVGALAVDAKGVTVSFGPK
jgi:hypothetical protein